MYTTNLPGCEKESVGALRQCLSSFSALLAQAIWLTGLFSLLIAGNPACIQAQGQTQITTPTNRRPVAVPTLYRHFLAYQNHLDKVGAKLDEQGEDGSGFRDNYQRKLGFSPGEFAPVRQAALQLEDKLKQHDAKIKAVIDAARAKYPRTLRSASELPPVPPELKELQKERDKIIQDEVDRLNAALGPTRAAKLQGLIENDFAPNVRVQTAHPLVAPHDPSKHPLPPFPEEVRP
jgi:hypothetical protein